MAVANPRPLMEAKAIFANIGVFYAQVKYKLLKNTDARCRWRIMEVNVGRCAWNFNEILVAIDFVFCCISVSFLICRLSLC